MYPKEVFQAFLCLRHADLCRSHCGFPCFACFWVFWPRCYHLELPISKKAQLRRHFGCTWIRQFQHYSDAINLLLTVDRVVLEPSAYASAPCIQTAGNGEFDWILQGIYDFNLLHGRAQRLLGRGSYQGRDIYEIGNSYPSSPLQPLPPLYSSLGTKTWMVAAS